MKRVGHLFEQVVDFHALCRAARRAAKGKHVSPATATFLMDLEPNVLALQRALLAGAWRPSPYRTFFIRDPKPRAISAAAFGDRVVHHALCAALEPVFERVAIFDSYACRPGKGGHAAVDRLRHFVRGGGWFVKLDVEHFFETASHAVLKAGLRRLVKDARALALCDAFIDAGAPGSPPGRGLPIGNLTSQHFANLYLAPLDHHIKRALGVRRYLRYMDDLVLVVPDRDAGRAARQGVAAFAAEHLALRLRDAAERQGPVSAGVPFLGLRVWAGHTRFDAARVRRWRRRMRGAARSRDGQGLARVESLVAWSEVAHALALRRSWLARHPWRRAEPTA